MKLSSDTSIPFGRDAAQQVRCRICSAQMTPWSDTWLGFRWGSCANCHSVQKLLNQEQYQALNPSYDPGFLTSQAPSPEALEAAMDVDKKYRLLRRYLGADANGLLLDIGCGMGGYLLAGRRLGLNVVGVEPSAAHSKAAVEVFGLEVRRGYFKAKDFDSRFDVVVLSHVIEHIFAPREFLADIMQVLSQNGRLIVITPNCESISAKVCGKFWSMYKPIDHVTMFSRKSLEAGLPEGAYIESFETSEWPGEFVAHVISAFKTAGRPRLGNIESEQAKPAVSQSTLGMLAKIILAIVSTPFFVFGAVTDKRSCCYAVIRKKDSS